MNSEQITTWIMNKQLVSINRMGKEEVFLIAKWYEDDQKLFVFDRHMQLQPINQHEIIEIQPTSALGAFQYAETNEMELLSM